MCPYQDISHNLQQEKYDEEDNIDNQKKSFLMARVAVRDFPGPRLQPLTQLIAFKLAFQNQF